MESSFTGDKVREKKAVSQTEIIISCMTAPVGVVLLETRTRHAQLQGIDGEEI